MNKRWMSNKITLIINSDNFYETFKTICSLSL